MAEVNQPEDAIRNRVLQFKKELALIPLDEWDEAWLKFIDDLIHIANTFASIDRMLSDPGKFLRRKYTRKAEVDPPHAS